MTAIVLPQSAESQPSGRGAIQPVVAIALTVWLLLVVSLGAAGAFVGPPGTPPLGHCDWNCSAPGALFRMAAASAILPRVRALPGSSAHCWNAGLAMGPYGLPLPLCVQGAAGSVRPASWPRRHGHRGHGPVDNPRPGASAWVCRPRHIHPLECPRDIGPSRRRQHRDRECLLRDRGPRKAILSTAPMATLPLLLIPAFLVPLFLMLHTAALMQSRQLIRSRA